VQNVELLVHYLDGTLLSDVVESDNTVRDALRFQNTDPTDLCSVVGMCTAASFSINPSDVHNTERVARNNTTLVEGETVLFFSFCFIHETLGDRVAAVDQSVGVILNCVLFFLCEALVVGDIQVSLLSGLFGTSLPYMWSKNIAA